MRTTARSLGLKWRYLGARVVLGGMARPPGESGGSTGTTLRGPPGPTATRRQVSVTAFGEGTCDSERASGFEPLTSSLGSCHSTTELRPQAIILQGLTSNPRMLFSTWFPHLLPPSFEPKSILTAGIL